MTHSLILTLSKVSNKQCMLSIIFVLFLKNLYIYFTLG